MLLDFQLRDIVIFKNFPQLGFLVIGAEVC